MNGFIVFSILYTIHPSILNMIIKSVYHVIDISTLIPLKSLFIFLKLFGWISFIGFLEKSLKPSIIRYGIGITTRFFNNISKYGFYLALIETFII